jgi:hypothetical protein
VNLSTGPCRLPNHASSSGLSWSRTDAPNQACTRLLQCQAGAHDLWRLPARSCHYVSQSHGSGLRSGDVCVRANDRAQREQGRGHQAADHHDGEGPLNLCAVQPKHPQRDRAWRFQRSSAPASSYEVDVRDGQALEDGDASCAQRSRAGSVSVAGLMRRTFGVDVLACPRGPGRLRLMALIDQVSVIQRILRHLGLPTDVPEPRPHWHHPAPLT